VKKSGTDLFSDQNLKNEDKNIQKIKSFIWVTGKYFYGIKWHKRVGDQN
jgi:hypothetical protein